MVTTVSLFSGCGGSDLALKQSGFDVIWANDIWELACSTYRDNFPGSKIECADISKVQRFPKAQLLVGCYPCQGYSQGGARDKEDKRNFLYRQFDRALRQINPKAFVVENVSGMSFGQNRELLDNQLTRYRSAGYRVWWKVLNAKDFGVAQNRRRIFLVGVQSQINYQYIFPSPLYGPGTGRSYVSQRDAIGEMQAWPEGEFNNEPFHWYYLSRKRRSPWGKPSQCIVGHHRQVPLHPISPPLKRIGTDEWMFSRPGRARRFSFRECAVLQGFPSSFKWRYGRLRDKYQLIGNAVPPPLFRAVVSPLKKIFNKGVINVSK